MQPFAPSTTGGLGRLFRNPVNEGVHSRKADEKLRAIVARFAAPYENEAQWDDDLGRFEEFE